MRPGTASGPRVFLLCGRSFSGKSTLAARLAAATGALVVSLDALNLERGLVSGDGVSAEEWGKTHEEARGLLAHGLAEGRDVVFDDTACFRFLRDDVRRVATAAGATTALLFLDVSRVELEARRAAAARAATRVPVRDEVFARHVDEFEEPGPDEEPVRLASEAGIAAYLESLKPKEIA